MQKAFAVNYDRNPNCISPTLTANEQEATRNVKLIDRRAEPFKPTLPGIDSLFSPCNAAKDGDEPSTTRWTAPRTPFPVTPLHSPPGTIKMSPISLPSIGSFKDDAAARTPRASASPNYNRQQLLQLPNLAPPDRDSSPNCCRGGSPSTTNTGHAIPAGAAGEYQKSRLGTMHRQMGAVQTAHLDYQGCCTTVTTYGERPDNKMHYRDESRAVYYAHRPGHHSHGSHGQMSKPYAYAYHPYERSAPHSRPLAQNQWYHPHETQAIVHMGGVAVEYDSAEHRSTGPLPNGPAGPNPTPMRGLGIYRAAPETLSETFRFPGSYGYGRGGDQPLITANKDIKRRTKTGCLTCRKRRIKCDEKHPTCLNCDKSKRICLGYDPIFKLQADKRCRKTLSITSTDSAVSPSSLGSGVLAGDESWKPGSPPGSKLTSPSIDAKDDEEEEGSSRSCPEDIGGETDGVAVESNANRMKIASLLDAAEVLESRDTRYAANKHWTATNRRSRRSQLRSLSSDVSVSSWDELCQLFKDEVAPELDHMLCTSRFGEIAGSCLPVHGKARDYAGRKGDVAALEAIRQLMSLLYPSLFLDGLAMDDSKAAKLEEMRITNNYKLLRCVVQLVHSGRDTQFLPVASSDTSIKARVEVLHRFVHNRDDALGPGEMTTVVGELATGPEVWRFLEHLAGAGRLSDEQIDTIAGGSARQDKLDPSLSVALLLGLHYAASRIHAARESRIRIRLLELSGSDVLAKLSHRLIDLTLNL